MLLTDLEVKSAIAKDTGKPQRYNDGKGLYLEVHANGSKYWRFKYRIFGKEKRLALGVYPKVKLKAARLACDEARLLLDQSIDPSQAKKDKKLEWAQAQKNDFKSVALEWHQQQSSTWSENYSRKVLSSITRDLFPYVGTLPVDTLTPLHFLDVFRRVEARGAGESAHRLKQTTGQILRFAVVTKRALYDVTRDLKGALATPKKAHFAAITEPDEVGRLLNTLDGYGGTYTVRAALKLAPLVFVRPKELRTAEWAEIDLEAAEWRIPAEKMKMGVDHIVPLSRQAIAILEEQKHISGHWQYVFPSGRSPRRPMSDNAVLSAFRNMGIPKEKMTGHGFRAMARTILDEVLEERVELIEHQLAHAVKDTLGRAYNRTTHLPKRREMMQRWADYLDELREQASNSEGG